MDKKEVTLQQIQPMEVNYIGGHYKVSLFRIHIETELPLENPAVLPVPEQTVYFHEYFHYVKDATSWFMMRRRISNLNSRNIFSMASIGLVR